jgi:phage terminase large subunit
MSSRRKVLVIRKVDRTIKDSVFELFTSYLKKWGLWAHCKVNYTTFTIELPNGSLFLFKGLMDSERIKSIADITDIWVEEATELEQEDFTQLDLRLRAMAPNLQYLVSFNPISRAHWIYKKWFSEKAVYDKENTMILRTTYKHNRFLPQSYIKALEDKIHSDPVYYRIYALGEFASLDKLIYTNWETGIYDHTKIPGQLLCGLDFGFTNDPTAFVAAVLNEDEKVIYIFKEWGATNKTNDEIAAVITSMGFSKSIIIADSAEQKSIEELKRLGLQRIRPCSKGKGSVLHGIQKLQQYKLVVNPDCHALITELENYSWKKENGEYVNKPVDNGFDHYLDSLRYSLECVQNNKVKTLNKAALGL